MIADTSTGQEFMDFRYQATVSIMTLRGVLGNLQVCPLFLPWHRAYLYFFELALQDQDPAHAVTLPWWDWDYRLDPALRDSRRLCFGNNRRPTKSAIPGGL